MFPFSSESEVIINQYHADPSLMSRVSRDKDLAAYGIGRFAVHARARLRAGSLQTESLGIYGRSDISGPLHGGINVLADLVHSDDEDHLFGALGDHGNPV